MKLGQPDTTARRIGPLRAFIGAAPVLLEDFSGAGEAEISTNDADFVACTGTFTSIGDGFYFYAPPIAEVSTEGFVVIKISGVCDEFTLREEIESAPQGIPAGTADATWLHAGPLYAVLGGAAVTGETFNGAGEIEVSINGAAWQAAGGAVAEMSLGYYDYVPSSAEVAAPGWLAVKITTVCDEYVIRVDVTDRFVPSATLQFGGRVESRMTVPAGGAAVSATNSGGGPTTCTVAAGNYYLSAAGGVSGLLDALETVLNASRPPSAGAWTVSLSTTTGLVTVNCTGTWSLSWTNTTLRDVLGFEANIVSATTARTGTKQARGLWFPNCPLYMDTADPYEAPPTSDRRTTESPVGGTSSLIGVIKYVNEGLVYSHVPRERVWESRALYSYASWEWFAKECLMAQGVSWFPSTSRFQFYWSDAGVDTLVGGSFNSGAGVSGWSIKNIDRVRPKQSIAGWTGLFRIEIGEIVSEG
jgi:hypothetical protein